MLNYNASAVSAAGVHHVVNNGGTESTVDRVDALWCILQRHSTKFLQKFVRFFSRHEAFQARAAYAQEAATLEGNPETRLVIDAATANLTSLKKI